MTQYLQGLTITGILGEDQAFAVVRNTLKTIRGLPAKVVKWFQSLLRLGERVLALEEGLNPDTVIARNFYLMDNGKIRGAFRLSDDGSPSFSMSDPDGETRLHCLLMEDGSPWVTLSDNNGVERVTLAGDDTPSVTVNDADGQSQVALRYSEGGGVVSVIGGGVSVYHPNFKSQATLGMLIDGTAYLALLDDDGKLRCQLVAGGPLKPSFSLMDEKGNTVLQAPPRDGPGEEDGPDWKAIGV